MACSKHLLQSFISKYTRVQKPVGHFIRAVLLIPLYVPLFAPKASSSVTASSVYTIVLKVRPSTPVEVLPCQVCLRSKWLLTQSVEFLKVVLLLFLLQHLKCAQEKIVIPSSKQLS